MRITISLSDNGRALLLLLEGVNGMTILGVGRT